MASLALGAVGAVAGGLFGQPALGFALGSFAGKALFGSGGQAENTEGSRLSSLAIQASQAGEMIPIVYGCVRSAGSLIWKQDLIEEVNVEDVDAGGKGGGGATSTTYEYFGTFAIGICEGPVGLRKIWADDELIYNAEPDAGDRDTRLASCDVSVSFYPGDETQLPDPIIESFEGVGQVPAHRGLAYIVFERLPLADYGNRIPNFTFEVCTGQTFTLDCNTTPCLDNIWVGSEVAFEGPVIYKQGGTPPDFGGDVGGFLGCSRGQCGGKQPDSEKCDGEILDLFRNLPGNAALTGDIVNGCAPLFWIRERFDCQGNLIAPIQADQRGSAFNSNQKCCHPWNETFCPTNPDQPWDGINDCVGDVDGAGKDDFIDLRTQAMKDGGCCPGGMF